MIVVFWIKLFGLKFSFLFFFMLLLILESVIVEYLMYYEGVVFCVYIEDELFVGIEVFFLL